MSYFRARSNVGAALSRRANKLLDARNLRPAVKVACSGFGDGCGSVESPDMEELMSARQVLVDGGIYCAPIRTFNHLPPMFCIAKDAAHAGVKEDA
jgi:hypothetical protein